MRTVSQSVETRSVERGADDPSFAPAQALESIPLGIAMTRGKGGEQVLLYINTALRLTTGMSNEELYARGVNYLMGDSSADEAIKTIRDVLDRGGSCRVMTLHTRPDGLRAWNELDLVEMCAEHPAPDERQFLWTFKDITQRIAIEELWRRYEYIVNNSKDFLALISRDFRYALVNQYFASALGLTPGVFVDAPVGSLSQERALGNAIHSYLPSAFQGKPIHFEDWYVLQNRGRRYLDVYLYPYCAEASTATHVVLVARDLTERKHAEMQLYELNLGLERRVQQRTAELEAANKSLESFGSSIAHDLRAPLRCINAFASVLEQDYESVLPNEAYELVGQIREGVKQMDQLIHDLHQFSRLGMHALTRGPIAMHEMVNEVVESAGAGADNPAVQVAIDALPDANADPSLVRQVLVNLVSNAIKFSSLRPNPSVHVGAMTDTTPTVYYVRDSGPGFDMRYHDEVFGVFRRLDNVEDTSGTGVGLAIVKRIVERHEGQVWAESIPNSGATFYFTLQPGEAASPENTASAQSRTG